MSCEFLTIAEQASARYTVKMSRFLAFIHPVKTTAEAKQLIKDYTAKYHDARHVCWAYMLGSDRLEYQLSDNGEPSGTAGRPILGQINSNQLTDVIILVVRYFGGIKLGTPGLIAAYKESARLAIESAQIIEQVDMAELEVSFPYAAMNDVMKIAKQDGIKILNQDFDNDCRMQLSIRSDEAENLKNRFDKLDSVGAKIKK